MRALLYFTFFKKKKARTKHFYPPFKQDLTGDSTPGTQFILFVKHALITLGTPIWTYLYGLLHCGAYEIKPKNLIMLYFLVGKNRTKVLD